MRTLTCDLLLTIDGYTAAVDAGPLFPYSGPELDAWVHANLDQPQQVFVAQHWAGRMSCGMDLVCDRLDR
jgi:hypothetical protein